MNENINLCEILKGLEGIELYSSVYGTVTFLGFSGTQLKILFHRKNAGDGSVFYESNGHLLFTINDDECTLFPSKDQRDWSKFERPIKEGTPMMCLKHLEDSSPWMLQQYREKRNGKHYVKHYNIYTRAWIESAFKYIIPFDKFNPNDIEGSLKYNIQK